MHFDTIKAMDEINQLIVELVDDQELEWSEVYLVVQEEYPFLSRPAIRGRYYKHSGFHDFGEDPGIYGVQAREVTSVDSAIAKAKKLWKETRILEERRKRQGIVFKERQPVCLVFMADVHAGSAGVDYENVFDDAEIIASTPGMYAILAGDLVDQFVLESMRDIRFHTVLSVPDEWAIVRGLLDLISHKILVSVSGNHDNWTNSLVGIDYFKDVLERRSPDALYAVHSLKFALSVEHAKWRIKVRHRWRYSSRYNPTHGIEIAASQDRDFDVGVGAHTHACGVARQFNNAGNTGLAILCGSYKKYDEFADYLGAPVANDTAAVPVVFAPSGTHVVFQSVAEAAAYMWYINGKKRRT